MFNNSTKRWYDADPTVSLAVSFIRNASEETQKSVARFIIEKAGNYDIKADETVIKFHRRWYDIDEDLSLAMNYFERASEEQKKAIALAVIEFLTEIK